MQGYLGRDDLTEAAFHDGWYVTGDQGFLSEDGFLKITGRLSRFSKIGGEMVPHGRIEESLQQAVGADEQVFAVTAVGDERKGEKLVVLHTLDDGQVEQALEGLGAQGLPNLFIPRRDHFIKVDAIPMLGTGKLDLKAIRRVAEEAISAVATVPTAALHGLRVIHFPAVISEILGVVHSERPEESCWSLGSPSQWLLLAEWLLDWADPSILGRRPINPARSGRRHLSVSPNQDTYGGHSSSLGRTPVRSKIRHPFTMSLPRFFRSAPGTISAPVMDLNAANQ